jgi:hypothetical protein
VAGTLPGATGYKGIRVTRICLKPCPRRASLIYQIGHAAEKIVAKRVSVNRIAAAFRVLAPTVVVGGMVAPGNSLTAGGQFTLRVRLARYT